MSGTLGLAHMKIGKYYKSGLSPLLQRVRLAAHLWLQCGLVKASAQSTKCSKTGMAFQSCSIWDERAGHLPLYHPSLDVDLEDSKTLGKLSAARAIPQEAWQMKAVYRHRPSTWGSKYFRSSLLQFHMASPFAALWVPLALLGWEPSGREKLNFVIGLWLS